MLKRVVLNTPRTDHKLWYPSYLCDILWTASLV